jgi:hypothetical protein
MGTTIGGFVDDRSGRLGRSGAAPLQGGGVGLMGDCGGDYEQENIYQAFFGDGSFAHPCAFAQRHAR